MPTNIDLKKVIPTTTTTAIFVFGGLFINQGEIDTPHEHLIRDNSLQGLEGLEGFESFQTSYNVTDKHIEKFRGAEAIHKFALNLLENIEDLDPEFSKLIDENFWDLI